MRRPAFLVLAVLVTSCGGSGDDGVPPKSDASADAFADANVDAATDTEGDTAPGLGANIADALSCGPTPPGGPGDSADIQRADIDTAKFPDALCNDGTAAIAYFRPFSGAANRNKWMINLHGGGSCSSGPSCASRWCNCASLKDCPKAEGVTNFDRTTMTNVGPKQKGGAGLFLRGGTGAQTNPLGDYNLVELVYCSSDLWRGMVKGVTFTAANPVTGDPVTYRINFLGAKIVDGWLTTLRQDGTGALVYTLGGASTPMPDLDEATEVIVTGDSAGGAGVSINLDYIHDTLKKHNSGPLQVYGLMDAFVGPDKSLLDYGAFPNPLIRSFDDYLTARTMSPIDKPGARRDESCLAMHSADPRICIEETHVVRHHITTPFFVRMALLDSNISGNYIEEGYRNPDKTPMTTKSFGLLLHDQLTKFADLPATAEEGATMATAPGVFGPACTKHDTIHENLDTFGTTITPAGGSPLRLLQVFENWHGGTGTPKNVLTESLTLADTVCP